MTAPEPSQAPGDDASPATDANPDTEVPTSGLKNPEAAARGVGMATLLLEFLSLLLAIQPIRIMAPDTPGWGLGIIAALACCCLVLAGLLRRLRNWHLGTALQIAVIATGVFQYSMFIVGAVFLAMWIYVLRIRADLAKPAMFDH